MSALAWLLGSPAGRTTILVLLAVLGAVLAVLRAFQKGEAAERARQAQASLDNLRNRIKTDDDIARLPADERRRRLAEWVSDDR